MAFNVAAAELPRKPTSLSWPSGWTTGLQCGRGRVTAETRITSEIQASPVTSLQCGRGRVTAETCQCSCQSARYRPPSMWPRQSYRGNKVQQRSEAGKLQPSMWPRQSYRGNLPPDTYRQGC